MSRVYGRGRGTVFSANDFLDRWSRDAVDKALSRLTAKGKIRRIARGLYDFPKQHHLLGELSPSPEAIAQAVAGKYQIRWMPTGAEATNLLHLSEQVPGRIVYLTDGPSRTIRVGNQNIELRQASPRKLAVADKMSGLVIEALRFLGEEHITDQRIQTLRDILSPKDKEQVLKDIVLAPSWMHSYLRRVAENQGA